MGVGWVFLQNFQFSSLLGEAGAWGALKPISVKFAECCRRLGMGGMGASSGEGEAWDLHPNWKGRRGRGSR